MIAFGTTYTIQVQVVELYTQHGLQSSADSDYVRMSKTVCFGRAGQSVVFFQKNLFCFSFSFTIDMEQYSTYITQMECEMQLNSLDVNSLNEANILLTKALTTPCFHWENEFGQPDAGLSRILPTRVLLTSLRANCWVVLPHSDTQVGICSIDLPLFSRAGTYSVRVHMLPRSLLSGFYVKRQPRNNGFEYT